MATPLASSALSTPAVCENDLPATLTELDLLNLDPHGALASPRDAPHFSHHAPADGRYTRHPGDFPPEIIALIVHHLYYQEVPAPQPFPNPDPYLALLPPTPWYPARLAPPLDEQASETFSNLCLVNKTWSAEATRALWRRVSFGMPRAFESVLRTIEEYSGGQRVARPLRSDLRGGGSSSGGSSAERSRSAGQSRERAAPSSLGLFGGTLPTEVKAGLEEPEGGLPTPKADVEPLGNGLLDVKLEHELAPPVPHLGATTGEPGQLGAALGAPIAAPLPTLDPAESPLLFTRSISFARFRTAGMKRTLRQGSNERFVTPHRLLTLLRGTRYPRTKLVKPAKRTHDDEDDEDSAWSSSEAESESETPGASAKRKKTAGQLCQVGFSEYMDSAITFEVLEEMLFRGGYLAEYEEPDEPLFPEFAPSSSESDLGIGLRSPFNPSTTSLVAPSPAEPFHYRDLGSSHSRSPSSDRGGFDADGRRTRSSSISTSIAEEDETMVDTDDEVFGSGSRTPVGRRPAHWMTRRASGSAFMPAPNPLQQMASSHSHDNPLQGYNSADDDFSSEDGHARLHDDSQDSDEDEPRGRERFGRSMRGRQMLPHSYSAVGLGAPPPTPSTRGRTRPGRSLLSQPPPLNRSASLPGHHHHAQLQSAPVGSSLLGANLAARSRPRQLSISRASERSSSVPASVSGRLWAAEPAPKRTVQVLEGSLAMQPVRGLDLCGCVSRTFVAALDEMMRTYKLGPPALAPASGSGMDTVGEEDEDDEMADYPNRVRTPSVRSVRLGWAEERVLNRTFFPHLRRLGLASSLLPSELLTAFVLSFPYLTHLDLASTLTSPMLLKGLALAGQKGIGGRPMRLKALSLARCRLITGPALLGLFCGDCPPLTTLAGLSDDDDEAWGAGEVVSELTDLSLFGDGTYPNPLEVPELRLVLSVSSAFRSGRLRTLDLSSAPMTDAALFELVPPQPNLIELGLAHCRAISMQGVATFLATKAPAVEVLDLSHSCPSNVGQGISSRRRVTLGQPTISIMELHAVLLSQCASLESASSNPEEAQLLLALRATNLRVVELDEKSLGLVQGGAGDWKPIMGKGRRGWYVDTATTSRVTPPDSPFQRPRQLVHLPRSDPYRSALTAIVANPSLSSSAEAAWHGRKMEVMRGDGLLGRSRGLYAYHAYA
ncbi:uncharacterized protein JCM10292_004733 [Rhodotorula paludigena]|uniref:uncharacterized protein n=1 Tax=Rhodotorula paludigena TaxID=86838 RepID=UPI00316CEE44